MRYILYLLCIVIVIFRDYFYQINPDAAERLSAFYLLAFTVVCVDIAVRVRSSAFLFFPVIIAILLYLGMTGLGEMNYYTFAYSALYFVLTIMLVRKAISANTAGEKSVATIFYAMSFFLFLLGLKVLTLITDLAFLSRFYELQIPNYLLAAFGGGLLIARKLPHGKYKAENELFLFLVFLNIITIARDLVADFFGAAGVSV